jgi:hypothetical protein
MATRYSGRFSKPLGANADAFGGAGLNLNIAALSGETEMVHSFDDFDDQVAGAGPGNNVPRIGWLTTVRGGAAGHTTAINPLAPSGRHYSCLQVTAGTAASTGINAIVDDPQDVAAAKPILRWPDRTDTEAMDNTSYVFACRVGLRISAGSVWDGQAFIGIAEETDTAILELVAANGIQSPTSNAMIGFHIASDGHIDLICMREGKAIAAENFTQMVSTTWNQNLGTGDHNITWFDLAFRAEVRDWDDASDNGAVTGYFRQVGSPVTTVGRRPVEQSNATSPSTNAWTQHPTPIFNETPFDAGVNALVPAIEVINGAGANLTELWVDWWVMAISRMSRGWEAA